MEKWKENARLLRQNSKKGISLVVALFASALLLGLSLWVIRSGASLMDQAVGTIEKERCGQLARSFAETLEAELLQDGITTKLVRMPEDVRGKFRGTLQRIVNEGAQGLICLIL